MKIIGHRGAMAHRLENTLSSFEYAMKAKVEMVELDVQLSKDKKIFVYHDYDLKRLTGKHGSIHKMNSSDIEAISLAGQQTIPTLEEVFQMIAGNISINIEIKDRNLSKYLSESIRRYIDEFNVPAEKLLVSSFDHDELMNFKKREPEIPLGMLYYGIPIAWDESLRLIDPVSVHFSLDFLDHNLIKELKDLGKKIYVYTVNNEQDLEAVQRAGGDGIFTNDPERFLSIK